MGYSAGFPGIADLKSYCLPDRIFRNSIIKEVFMMVKHMIIWRLKDEYSDMEKAEHAARIKSELEALDGVIDGLVSIAVYNAPLSSSSGDIMLDSTFESVDALAGYQVHPAHVKAATFVRSVVEQRLCMDFEQ